MKLDDNIIGLLTIKGVLNEKTILTVRFVLKRLKNKFEIFVDTDILWEHLSLKRNNNSSVLQKAIDIFDGCYTSVINASEIFSECPDEKMLIKAKNSFENIGILGIPFRYSVKIGELMKEIKKKTPEIL